MDSLFNTIKLYFYKDENTIEIENNTENKIVIGDQLKECEVIDNNIIQNLEKSSLFLYILSLENGKYYIGKTDDVNRRFLEHMSNKGSEWTKKYKPVEILEVIDDCDEFDEDKYTFKMMALHGIDNVRGGSFVQINLTKDEITFLQKRLNCATDKCIACGSEDHFIKDCPIKKRTTAKYYCSICKKYNHNTIDCYKKLKYYCSICNKNDHNTVDCYKNKPCYRCGRKGHTARECFANTDVNGKKLTTNL